MDLLSYQLAARAHYRQQPATDRERTPAGSTLHADMQMVGERLLPYLLEAYGLDNVTRLPGGRQAIASAIRCQLTAWLLDTPCQTWLGLDIASINTVCWFIGHAPPDVLREAALAAHKTRPIPTHHHLAWSRFLANAPKHPF